jgi:hypothetical protein
VVVQIHTHSKLEIRFPNCQHQRSGRDSSHRGLTTRSAAATWGRRPTQTKNYIIGVLSLREAAMGMNRVLTGSARASESQIKALQATLPGYEPNSGTALQRLRSFAQNVDQLRKPIPVIPGVPRTPITFGQ